MHVLMLGVPLWRVLEVHVHVWDVDAVLFSLYEISRVMASRFKFVLENLVPAADRLAWLVNCFTACPSVDETMKTCCPVNW